MAAKKKTAKSKDANFTKGINALIQGIDNYLLDVPLMFESGRALEYDAIYEVKHLLYPNSQADFSMVDDSLDKIPDKKLAEEAHTALWALIGSEHECMYKAGVLMGMRAKGATVDELRRVGERWRRDPRG